MLVKLTPGVTFINILQSVFLHKSVLSSFSVLTVSVCIVLSKKAVHKMLMKLTPVCDKHRSQCRLEIGESPMLMLIPGPSPYMCKILQPRKKIFIFAAQQILFGNFLSQKTLLKQGFLKPGAIGCSLPCICVKTALVVSDYSRYA